jgi:hypothetical protein
LLSQVGKLFRIHAARHYHGAAVSIRQFRSASFDPAPTGDRVSIGDTAGRERCTQAKAFEILRGASQNSNVKLRDIASAIVTSVSGEPPQPHAFEEG